MENKEKFKIIKIHEHSHKEYKKLAKKYKYKMIDFLDVLIDFYSRKNDDKR